MELRPPLEPALVRPPGARPWPARSGAVAFEPKWDGFRCLAFRGADGTVLQTRRGRILTRWFPDVVAALDAQLPPGTVVDGELVSWDGRRLRYGRLQARLAPAAWAGRPTPRSPAGLVLFDLPGADGQDLRARPYRERRARLEALAGALGSPLFLTRSTDDPAEARTWFDRSPDEGVEGLVAKPLDGAYLSGQPCWDQFRNRTRSLGVVAGVLGTPTRPVAVVLGQPQPDGRLRVLGATRPLPAPLQEELGERLAPAGPGHPWPADPLPGSWVGRSSSEERVSYLRVEPALVAEVVVDRAWDPQRWRHTADLVRLRPDLHPADLADRAHPATTERPHQPPPQPG